MDNEKKNTTWKLEDQEWWQRYSAMVMNEKLQREKQAADGEAQITYTLPAYGSDGSGMIGAGSGYMGSGSGFFVRSSGYMGSGSGFFAYGSGYMGSGSGFFAYGSGYMGSGSGFYAMGSGYMGSGSGLYTMGSGFAGTGSNVTYYVAASEPPKTFACMQKTEDVFVPEYLKNSAQTSANQAAGVLAYGLELI